jgi:hypothetical protein
MIAAMNRGCDAAKKAALKEGHRHVCKAKTEKKKRVIKKSPLPLRKTGSSKARKKLSFLSEKGKALVRRVADAMKRRSDMRRAA